MNNSKNSPITKNVPRNGKKSKLVPSGMAELSTKNPDDSDEKPSEHVISLLGEISAKQAQFVQKKEKKELDRLVHEAFEYLLEDNTKNLRKMVSARNQKIEAIRNSLRANREHVTQCLIRADEFQKLIEQRAHFKHNALNEIRKDFEEINTQWEEYVEYGKEGVNSEIPAVRSEIQRKLSQLQSLMNKY